MSVCRSCGAHILWGETSEGKKIPLDSRAPVYTADPKEKSPRIIRLETARVSHFATCPEANQWSGRRAGEPAPEKHFSEPKDTH